jgi:hypothetical protein
MISRLVTDNDIHTYVDQLTVLVATQGRFLKKNDLSIGSD